MFLPFFCDFSPIDPVLLKKWRFWKIFPPGMSGSQWFLYPITDEIAYIIVLSGTASIKHLHRRLFRTLIISHILRAVASAVLHCLEGINSTNLIIYYVICIHSMRDRISAKFLIDFKWLIIFAYGFLHPKISWCNIEDEFSDRKDWCPSGQNTN